MNSFGQNSVETTQAYLASRTPSELVELVVSFTKQITQLEGAAYACRRAGHFELATGHDAERAQLVLDRDLLADAIIERCAS